jgi:poly-gamma-glutamate synthesis protein (capsule biosynthesis protein)
MRTRTLFLAGDVMTGRGVDQILAEPVDPVLRESWIRDARDYVDLAERASGPIPRRVADDYVWGEALDALEAARPDARLVNLETSVTTSEDFWPGKGVHYRTHPRNAGCLEAARVDVAGLANNHTLDFGRSGLIETLTTLDARGVGRAGAGSDLASATAPASVSLGEDARLLVFAVAAADSGVPPEWAATEERSGIWRLEEVCAASAGPIEAIIERYRRPRDVVVLSIHWGGNWGFDIPERHRALAHALIDRGAVDLVHGHSSHHVKGLELYRGHLVIHGAGDLLTDYEGIGGMRAYRGELGLLYFPTLSLADGRLTELVATPTRVRKLRLERARGEDAAWLEETLDREGRARGLGTRVIRTHDDQLVLVGAADGGRSHAPTRGEELT